MAADPTQLSGIRFINDQERQYFAEAMVGEEVTSFLNSTSGQYLHGRAKKVYNQCVQDMFEINPYTAEGKKEHDRIKRDAWCALHFMEWCSDAIIEGKQAAVQLETYRDD